VITRFKGSTPGEDHLHNPVNGVKKDNETISGHRDWLQTDCPGQTMYDLLEK